MKTIAPILMLFASLPMSGCIIGGSPHQRMQESMELVEAAGSFGGPETAGASTLRVSNSVGDIILVSDPSATEVHAKVVMQGRGRSKKEAEAALDEIDVSLGRSGSDASVIEARSMHPNGSNRRQYSVDWTITAPPNLNIVVENDVGEIEAKGFLGSADLRTDVGDIKAGGFRSGAMVRTNVGDVEVSSAAPVEALCDVGSVEVDVTPGPIGPVTVRSNVGDVALTLPSAWVGEFDARSNIGDIDLRGQRDWLRMSLVRDTRVEGTITGTGAAADADMKQGRVEISTDIGDVRVGTSR